MKLPLDIRIQCNHETKIWFSIYRTPTRWIPVIRVMYGPDLSRRFYI
jgi:hypothetical protein